MTLRDFLFGTTRWPEPIDEFVTEEAAVAAATVKHAIRVDANSVVGDLEELFDERAQRRLGTAVGREAHQLDLALVGVPPEILSSRGVKPAKRVRQSDVPHLTQRAALAVIDGHRPFLAVSIENEDGRFIQPRTVEGGRSVTEMVAVKAQTRYPIPNKPTFAQSENQALLKIPGMEMQQ